MAESNAQMQRRNARLMRMREVIVAKDVTIAALQAENAALRAEASELRQYIGSPSRGDLSSNKLPEGIWDEADNVYRCSNCMFEVCEGTCQNSACARMHDYKDNDEHLPYYNSMTTEDDYILDDRRMAPRGSTPILDEEVNAAYSHCPQDFDKEQYAQLIARGASRAMIQLFDMEWTDSHGMVAWADNALFDTYSSDLMLPGEEWKIHLGRRVVLNYDDLDGSMFLEDLLDEIIQSTKRDIWETVKEDSTWVTRPTHFGDDAAAGESSEDDSDSSNSDDLPYYQEDHIYEEVQDALKDPLRLNDDYQSSDSSAQNDTSDEEEDELASPSDSEPDWSEYDLTERELARRRPSASAQSLTKLEDNGAEMKDAAELGSDDNNLATAEDAGSDSDIPGSDWDSNDDIE